MRVYALKFLDELLYYTLFLYIIITLYIILYNNIVQNNYTIMLIV